MRKAFALIILALLVFDKSFASQTDQDCEIKYIDKKHLDEDCQADEIIEVWCLNKASGEVEIISQCFTYYEKDAQGNNLKDSKLKCDYY